jgi:superfamily II DNA or RNA helicase
VHVEHPRQLGELAGAGGVASWLTAPSDSHFESKPQPKITLLSYQTDICDRLNACIAAGQRRPLVVVRTAGGKTVIAVEMIRQAIERGEEVLVVVHTTELIAQTSEKLLRHDAALGDHGFIKAGRPTRSLARIQVASVQTLHARVFRSKKIDLQKFGLIVIDEAHHARAKTYQQIVDAFPDAVIIGLTATPCRGDGRGLGNIFDVIVQGPSFEVLKNEGRLVGSKIYAPVRPDLKGVKTQQGDYVESELAARMDKAKLVGDIVTHWFRHGQGRRTVVFATGVRHSLHIRDEFRKAGVLAEHIDGTTPKDEREAILAKLAGGEIQVVTNCMVLTEGWDQPQVSCLILARPTKRLGLYHQMVGRVLRTAPGKEDAVIIDHSGAVFDHGFPEDEICWALEIDDKAVNEAHAARLADPHSRGLTMCPECSAVRMEGYPCGSCGWRPQAKPAYVGFREGDLGEVRRDRSVHGLPLDEQKFYRELKAIWRFKRLRKPDLKEGWISHKFKDRLGRFPPWDWQHLEPTDPTAATISWVRSRDIAYAKSMGGRRR